MTKEDPTKEGEEVETPAPATKDLTAQITEGIKSVLGSLLESGELIVETVTGGAPKTKDPKGPLSPREEESRMETLISTKIGEFLAAEKKIAKTPPKPEPPVVELAPGPGGFGSRVRSKLWGDDK